jgi:hypothetical protein
MNLLTSLSISKYFRDSIYPEFPFADPTWAGIAFDRDNYDYTRMPELFFRRAVDTFAEARRERIFVRGFGAYFDSRPGRRAIVDFEWTAYRKFVMSKQNYSPEYQMVGSSGQWACWMDPELTVWGGTAEKMNEIYDLHGGREHVLTMMRSEFRIEDDAAHAQMLEFFRTLLRLQ